MMEGKTFIPNTVAISHRNHHNEGVEHMLAIVTLVGRGYFLTLVANCQLSGSPIRNKIK